MTDASVPRGEAPVGRHVRIFAGMKWRVFEAVVDPSGMATDARDSWWSWRTEDIKQIFEWPTRWLPLNVGLFVVAWLVGSGWLAWRISTRPINPEPVLLAVPTSLVLFGLPLFLFWITIVRWPPKEAEVGRFDNDVMFALIKEARTTARHADRTSIHWLSLLVLVHGSIIGVWLWLADRGWWETALTQAVRTISSLLLFLFTVAGFSVVSRALRAANQEFAFVKRYAHSNPWSRFIEEGRRTGLERLMDALLSLGLLMVAYGWLVYFAFQLAELMGR